MEEGEEGEQGLPEISPKKGIKVMLYQRLGSKCFSSHSHSFQGPAQAG